MKATVILTMMMKTKLMETVKIS